MANQKNDEFPDRLLTHLWGHDGTGVAGKRRGIEIVPNLADGTNFGDQQPTLMSALQTAKTLGGYVQLPATSVGIRLNTPIVWERGFRLEGVRGDRPGVTAGTSLLCYGSGGIIQGADDGSPWDDSDYNGGPQGGLVRNIYFKAIGTTTPLANGKGSYVAGTYGWRDWGGGDMMLEHVTFESFEYGTWGVQSDLNVMDHVNRVYCRYGSYIGPRSDQWSDYDAQIIYCDTGLDIDQAQVRVFSPSIIECGSNLTAPFVVRKGGSRGVSIYDPWLENLNAGYQGEIASYFSIGEQAGYSAGNVGQPTILIVHPFFTITPQVNIEHVKYMVTGDDCNVTILHPSGASMNNFVAYFASTGAAQGHYLIENSTSILTTAKLGVKLGAGTPRFSMVNHQFGSTSIVNSVGRFYFEIERTDAAWMDKSLRLSAESAGNWTWSTPDSASDNKTRIQWVRRQQSGGVPTTLTYARGDRRFPTDPTPASPIVEYTCTVAGTPGTWRQSGHIVAAGATGSRPTLTANDVGVMYLDTTLTAAGKPIWWTGTAWVDATGVAA